MVSTDFGFAMLVAQSTQEVAHYHVDVLDCSLSLQFNHDLTVIYTTSVPDKQSICLSEQLILVVNGLGVEMVYGMSGGSLREAL